jgi:hypothetical protein
MFQLVFTCATDQMTRLFPSSGENSMCLWFAVYIIMNDKNPEKQINIKFCVKIGNSASETLALLTLAYNEYDLKKSSVSEWHRRFKEG